MKLNQLSAGKQRKLNKIIESRFGVGVNFKKMTPAKAKRLSRAMTESLNKIRKSHGVHVAEKNPRYMECLMIKESVDTWLKGAPRRHKLTEGEIEQAEAVLAAKDIVNRLQKMYEDVASIVSQDLPPLSDVIRDQMGSEQAEQFTSSASSSLSTLQEQLMASREAMDNASRALAGEDDAMMGGDMDMGMGDTEDYDDDMGADLDMDADLGMDADLDMDADVDGFDATPAATGGDLELGRELR